MNRLRPLAHFPAFRPTAKRQRYFYKAVLLSLFVLGTSGSSSRVFAQADIHFSQFYESSMLRNPALTGVFSDNYKFGVVYRSQWSSITNPYQTIKLNAEYRFALGRNSYDFMSIGLLAYQDVAGDIDQKIAAAYPAININKQIDPGKNAYISFGFIGGYLQYSFDPAKATFNNQFQNGVFSAGNPTNENLPVPRMGLMDIGAGINYNTSFGESNDVTVLVGVAGYHFTQPVFSYYRDYRYVQNVRFNVNASIVKEIDDNLVFQLHGNYASQGTFSELVTGCLLGYRPFAAMDDALYTIYGGLIYRYQDAIAPTVKLKYQSLAVGLSYDINISSLSPASNARGGIELTAFLTGTFPKNKGYDKKAPCPRF